MNNEKTCLDCVYSTRLSKELSVKLAHDIVKCDYPMPAYILGCHIEASQGKYCAVMKTKLDLKNEIIGSKHE